MHKKTRFASRKKSLIQKFNFKTISVITLVALIAGGVLFQAKEARAFSGGSGTVPDPYLITTCVELQAMDTGLSLNYKLSSNVDCSASSAWNGGQGFIPVGTNGSPFTGTLNGDNYTISGLAIARSSNYAGLFGYTSGATISATNMTGVSIAAGGSYSYVGGLAGYASATTITTSSVAGTVSGNFGIGLLVGWASSSTISKSYTSGTATGTYMDVGGLAGIALNTTISETYSTANATAADNVGGLLGAFSATGHILSNSYATGNVVATGNGPDGHAGGLAGDASYGLVQKCYSTGTASGLQAAGLVSWANTNDSSNPFSNTFWDTTTSGTSTAIVGQAYVVPPAAGTITGRTTAQMKDVATFTATGANLTSAWDFVDNPNNDVGNSNIWGINGSINGGYPFLTFSQSPYVNFASSSSNGAESTTIVNLQVNTSWISSRNVTVDYAVTGGTATGTGTDYTLASGTATITAGNTSTNISIAVVNDLLQESNETISVTLSNATNGTVGITPTHTYTINDNDNATIQFATTSSSGAESSTPVLATVTLSTTLGVDATVDYAVTGTATGGGTDYTRANGTLTITAGQTSGDISIAITPDATPESNETVILTLSNPTNATLGSDTVFTYTINNDDYEVQFDTNTGSGAESATPVIATVNLSGTSALDTTIDYSFSGTATSGSDYTPTSGTITIAAGLTSGNISLPITDDETDEAAETIILTLYNPTNATLGTNTAFTYTITDNDNGPTVGFVTTTANVIEGTTGAIPVQLSAASTQSITVDYTVADATAAGSGTDYTLASGTLTFNAGVTTKFISPVITNDSLKESDETFTITLSNPTNSTLTANTVDTVTLKDNDSFPAIEFNTPYQTAVDGGTEATLTFALSKEFAPGQDTVVEYTVVGGNAQVGTDYSFAGTPLTSNGLTRTIHLNTVNRGDGGTRTVIVGLSNPTNAVLGEKTQATVFIRSGAVASSTPTFLTVNGRTSPATSVSTDPYLGWQFTPGGTGDKQTSYQLLIASSENDLTSGPYVCDSGKVSSLNATAKFSSICNGTLTAGTYYWKVKTYNVSDVTSSYSSVNIFTVSPTLTAPSGCSVSSITADSLTVTWSDNSSNETGFEVEESGIAAGEIISNGIYKRLTTTSANSVSYSVSNLAPGNGYFFRVRGVSNTQRSSYATCAIAVTLPGTPRAPIITPIGSTTLKVQIAPRSDTISYAVQVNSDYLQANGTLAGTPVYQYISSWGYSKNITGLTPNTAYSITVLTQNAYAQSGPSSSTVIGNTLAATPVVTTSAVSSTTFRTTIGTGSNPSDTLYAITVYDGTQTRYVQTDGSLGNTLVQKIASEWGVDNSIAIVGLTADTTYKVQEIAYSNATANSPQFLAYSPVATQITTNGSSATFTPACSAPVAPTITLDRNTFTTTNGVVNVNDQGNAISVQYLIVDGYSNLYLNQYGNLTSTPSWNTYANFGGASGITANNLSSESDYLFMIKGKNCEGEETTYSSGTSIELPRRTPSNAPTITATTERDGVSSVNIVINPDSAAEGDSRSEFAIYDANLNKYISTTGILSDTAGWQTYNNWGGSSGITVYNLPGNTSHTFMVKARDRGDTPVETNFSPGATVSTLTDSPVISPQTISSSSVTIQAESLNNQESTGYIIEIGDGQYVTPNAGNVTLSGTKGDATILQWDAYDGTVDGFITINGFSPNALTNIRLIPRNDSDTEGEPSRTISVYTGSALPTGLAVEAANATRINFSWSNASNPTGTPLQIIETGRNLYANASNVLSGTSWTNWDTNISSWYVAGLAPDTNYCFKMKTKNTDGVEGSYTEEQCARTPTSPLSISKVSATDASFTLAVSTGDFPAETEYAIESVSGQYLQAGGTNNTFAGDKSWATKSSWAGFDGTSDEYITISGFSPNTLSNIRIIPRNVDLEEGTPSDTLPVYTNANIPNNIAASAISSTEINIGWGINGNAIGTEYEIQETGTQQYVSYSNGLNANILGSNYWSNWNNVASVTVSGLSASTQYCFKMRARNGGGDSTGQGPDANLCATTQDAPLYQPIISLSSKTANSGTIQIDPNGNVDAVTYAIEKVEGQSSTYLQTNTSNNTFGGSKGWATRTQWNNYDGTSDSFTNIGGFNPNTSVTLQAIPRNLSLTEGTTSASINFYTSSAVPSNLAVTAPSDSTATITWEANSNPNGTKYEIFETTTNKYVNAIGYQLTSEASWSSHSDLRTLSVAGLTASTEYCFRIKSRNENNEESDFFPAENTNAICATTQDAPLFKPIIVKNSVSTTGFKIDLQANGNIAETQYKIETASGQYLQAGGTNNTSAPTASWATKGQWITYGNSDNDGFIHINELTPNVARTLRVTPRNLSQTEGTASDPLSIYTAAAAPTGITATATSTNQINVSWSENSNPNGTEYKINDNGSWSTFDNEHRSSITGLREGTTFSYKVKARNGDGEETAFSSEASATTQSSAVIVVVPPPVIVPPPVVVPPPTVDTTPVPVLPPPVVVPPPTVDTTPIPVVPPPTVDTTPVPTVDTTPIPVVPPPVVVPPPTVDTTTPGTGNNGGNNGGGSVNQLQEIQQQKDAGIIAFAGGQKVITKAFVGITADEFVKNLQTKIEAEYKKAYDTKVAKEIIEQVKTDLKNNEIVTSEKYIKISEAYRAGLDFINSTELEACTQKIFTTCDWAISQDYLTETIENSIILSVKDHLARTISQKAKKTDSDKDGLSDYDETFTYGTNLKKSDTDDDKISDGDEVKKHKTNPLSFDSDGDGLADGDEVKSYKTSPLLIDTDNDNWTDKQEVDAKTDPKNALSHPEEDEDISGTKDTDDDGLSDLEESRIGTRPDMADTDGDKFSDGEELDRGTNPLKFDAPNVEIELGITNLRTGMKMAESPLVKGSSKANGTVIIYAKNEIGIKREIGRAIASSNNLFAVQTKQLANGLYYIQAQNEKGEVSDPTRITIDSTLKIERPHLVSFNGREITEADFEKAKQDSNYLESDSRPELELRVPKGTKMVMTNRSAIGTAILISDTPSGILAVRPPEELELGEHEIIAYAVNEKDNTVSPVTSFKFKVTESSSFDSSAFRIQNKGTNGIVNFLRQNSVKPIFQKIFIGLGIVLILWTLLSYYQDRKKK